MDAQKIKRLTEEWEDVTDKVIRFENPGYDKVRTLFKETFEVFDKYCRDKLVPKEISGLLLEMTRFGWWVSDLEETPLYCRYQDIVSLIFDMNRYFLTCDAQIEAIKEAIEGIA